VSTSTPPEVVYDARLVQTMPAVTDRPDAWFITHPLGGPAAGTYTEVVIEPNPDGTPSAGAPLPAHIVEHVVCLVALELYGNAWAFVYPPEQRDRGTLRARRRECVVVEGIEVLS
jgi:hypothetical protein